MATMDLTLNHPDRCRHLPSAINHGTRSRDTGEIEYQLLSIREFKRRYPTPVLKAGRK